jgi:predicted acylesterase/phospholipase RssA
MGESPWAVHEAADAVPRLEWAWYDSAAGWQMSLARAVAASVCVPGVFAPLELGALYEGGVKVRLVDGGVHDNQGTVSLLALNCNLVLISDACGQLTFEDASTDGLRGLAAYGKRAMDMLMERIRLANFSDLSFRRQMGPAGFDVRAHEIGPRRRR